MRVRNEMRAGKEKVGKRGKGIIKGRKVKEEERRKRVKGRKGR